MCARLDEGRSPVNRFCNRLYAGRASYGLERGRRAVRRRVPRGSGRASSPGSECGLMDQVAAAVGTGKKKRYGRWIYVR
jgi:hypothetical protein